MEHDLHARVWLGNWERDITRMARGESGGYGVDRLGAPSRERARVIAACDHGPLTCFCASIDILLGAPRLHAELRRN